jgi:hypothetical protein
MGKAFGIFLIAVASGLLIYWAVAPLLLPSAAHPASNPVIPVPAGSPDPTAQPASTTIPTAPNSPAPLPAPAPGEMEAPRTPEQKEVDAREAKRRAYYEWVKRTAADRVSDVTPATDDAATLVLYTRYDSPDLAATLANDVILPYAYGYGFRHVRYFVPNPPGSVERYRYDAESNADADGSWHTFKK